MDFESLFSSAVKALESQDYAGAITAGAAAYEAAGRRDTRKSLPCCMHQSPMLAEGAEQLLRNLRHMTGRSKPDPHKRAQIGGQQEWLFHQRFERGRNLHICDRGCRFLVRLLIGQRRGDTGASERKQEV